VEQCGVIVGLDDGNAIVSVKRDTACGKCKVCPSGSQEDVLIKIPNDINGKPGDIVGIDMEPLKLLQAATIVYLIPLVGLILGVLTGIGIAPELNLDSEMSGVAGGILLTMITFFGIKLFEPYFRKRDGFSPKIVYKLRKYGEGDDKDGN